MLNLPVTIDPCPITEAIFEIRFETSFPDDAIFGIIYKQFKDDFPHVTQMPVLQLPAAVRAQDPNLKFTPHYKLSTDNFIIQIGPNVFSLINLKEYCGWREFSYKIQETYTKLTKIELIEKHKRTALRYINLFEGMNIFDCSTMEIFLQNDRLGQNKVNITTEIPYDYGISKLKIVNHAQVKIENKMLQGSIIDIDTEVYLDQFFDFADAISRAHDAEKVLFFSLLQDDFLQSLNPQY